MDDRGLIERRREGSDSRRIFIYLTDEGRTLIQTLIPVILQLQEKATSRLSPKEILTLRQLLSRVREALDEED
jgi:DNA-binding MarR family transcriptional regulator